MRCKACNNVMSPNEIKYNKIRKSHEELCNTCLYSIDLGKEILEVEDVLLSEGSDGDGIEPITGRTDEDESQQLSRWYGHEATSLSEDDR